jgi:hypothetical protein
MKIKQAITGLFFIAALYDGMLGAAFLLFSDALFSGFSVTPPNHPGYVQFPAALLIVFAIMFTSIAIDPIKNRTLIPYGILLKVSYCGVILSHWLTGGIPNMWKPFCVSDLIFLAAFIWAWMALRDNKAQTE